MKLETENNLERILEALENPASFTSEELKELFSDKENLKYAQSILYARNALTKQHIPTPNIENEWKKFEQKHKKSLTPYLIISLSAACIALFFLLTTPWNQKNEEKIFEASQLAQTIKQDTTNGVVSISIPRGIQKQVVLPDSTIITLNAESHLSYDISHFGKKERKISFNGEGLFKVAKDSVHPFVVQSGPFYTQVLGTVFNLRNYTTEEPKVTLLSGSIKVSSTQSQESLYIQPGQQAVWTIHNKLLTIEDLPTNDITSWSEGAFYFDNQTLSEILCELGRWYNVNVIFKDKSCISSRLHFKAYRSDSLSSVVELLNYISPQPITFEKKTITVGK